MIECPACGTRADDGARFCASCGTRLPLAAATGGASAAQGRDGRLHRHRRLDGAGVRARSGSAACADEPLLRRDARRGASVTAGGSTSSSATRSWRSSAYRSSHEDDALRAVRAASGMRDRARTRSTTSSTGDSASVCRLAPASTPATCSPATRRRLDSFTVGDAVNVAARLEQNAAPGEILLGETTYALVRHGAHAEPIEPLAGQGQGRPAARISARGRRGTRTVDPAAPRLPARRPRRRRAAGGRGVRGRGARPPLPPRPDPRTGRSREVAVGGRGHRRDRAPRHGVVRPMPVVRRGHHVLAARRDRSRRGGSRRRRRWRRRRPQAGQVGRRRRRCGADRRAAGRRHRRRFRVGGGRRDLVGRAKAVRVGGAAPPVAGRARRRPLGRADAARPRRSRPGVDAGCADHGDVHRSAGAARPPAGLGRERPRLDDDPPRAALRRRQRDADRQPARRLIAATGAAEPDHRRGGGHPAVRRGDARHADRLRKPAPGRRRVAG